jgi:drug/metabolite transporter (DMT)-like permease
MTSWYVLSLAALVLLGGQRFLYKVSAETGCNSAVTTFSFMGTVAVLSWGAWLAVGQGMERPWGLLTVALVNSLGFLVSALATIEALRELPASVTYTVTRLSTVLVVGFSLFYFRERLTPSQGAGVLLALAVILLLARSRGESGGGSGNHRRGFALALLAVLGGAAASISSKFAALHVDKFGFMAVSYTLSAAFSLLAKSKLLANRPGQRTRPALWIGLAMGLTNFAGYYALLKALAVGPLSIIAPLTSLYFVIAILLSLLFYRERLTALRVAGVMLTVLSIVLMKV